MKIETELAHLYKRHGYQWKIGETLVSPTADDIRKTIDAAVRLLYNESSPTAQIEIGRLIIKKAADFHDIYVLVGSQPIKKEET